MNVPCSERIHILATFHAWQRRMIRPDCRISPNIAEGQVQTVQTVQTNANYSFIWKYLKFVLWLVQLVQLVQVLQTCCIPHSAWLRLATDCYPSAPSPCVSGQAAKYSTIQCKEFLVQTRSFPVPVDSESIANFRVSNSDHDFFPIVRASAIFECTTEPAQHSFQWFSSSIRPKLTTDLFGKTYL